MHSCNRFRQGCISTFIFCESVSRSSCSSQCGSGSSSYFNVDPDSSLTKVLKNYLMKELKKGLKSCSKVKNHDAGPNLPITITITISNNFLSCFMFFTQNSPSWIRIRILNADPDPGGKMNADPDPQPWFPSKKICTLLLHIYM